MLGTLYKWHIHLSILAGAALLLWAGSGVLHPILSFTALKPASFMPPITPFTPKPLPAPTLPAPTLPETTALRVLSWQGGIFYQITAPQQPERLYYKAETGEQMAGVDAQRAIALARHYSGEKTAAVKSAILQTSFDRAYPPINKYLPVWRVAFAREDGLTVYVDTSNDKLGTQNTHLKELLQGLFQRIHTLDFLQLTGKENARLLIITLCVVSVIAMASLGVGLLFTLKRRKKIDSTRRFHRLLGMVVWIPILMFSTSGLFHLWMHSNTGERNKTPIVFPLLNLQAMTLPTIDGIVQDMRVLHIGENVFWRVEIPAPQTPAAPKLKHDPHQNHGGGGGAPLRATAHYYNAQTGEKLPLNDGAIAVMVAEQALGKRVFSTPTLTPTFTQEYGFANKRLPVWRLESPQGLVFVDSKHGVIAATVSPLDKAELWSFNMLHKWQFFDKILGLTPKQRDGIITVFAVLIISMTLVGYRLRWKRYKQRCGKG
jgi:hypothetical protein